jgi:2-polyprenyl-3-methyl-5-hydroxy-6-metoxy-1,4-benzoquinol methylase
MIFKKKLNIKYKYYSAEPTPSKEFLNNFYSKFYFKNKLCATYSKKYSPEELKNKKKKAELIINFILTHINKKKNELLEIGSGEGFLLKAAHDHNFKISGVDYNDYAIKIFNKSIINFFTKCDPDKYLNELILNKKKFDIVLLQNVLEHVPDPSALILNIKKILFKNSYLFIQVPNDFKDLHFLLKDKKYINNFWFFGPPQHLNYFNSHNIKYFFQKYKFKFIDAMSDFPIELFLAFKKNYVNNPKTKSTESHKARIFYDNFILDQGHKKSSNFYKACYDVGIGRSIILLLKNI